MPAPFNKVYYEKGAWRYLSGKGNPIPAPVSICLKKLVTDICSGARTIKNLPAAKRRYFPVLGCLHKIFIFEDKHNNLFIEDVVPTKHYKQLNP